MSILDYLKIGLGALAGAVLCGLIVGPLEHAKGYASGISDMKAAVERQNAAAAETARKARVTLDDCYQHNGQWDQETGKCK